MPQLNTSLQFSMMLSPTELNLVSRGLRRLLKEEEKNEAEDLAYAISKQKAAQVRSMLMGVSKLDDSLEMKPREIQQQ